MRNDYEERKEARIERYEKGAENARNEAESRYSESMRLAHAMQGEPIHVGHHSEKRHRRDIDRMHNHMGKSVEATERAQILNHRADAAQSNQAISSDDPEAVTKLWVKLEKAEQSQKL